MGRREAGGGSSRGRGEGEGGAVGWDNFKYHLCPSGKRGVSIARPCRKKCSRGLR